MSEAIVIGALISDSPVKFSNPVEVENSCHTAWITVKEVLIVPIISNIGNKDQDRQNYDRVRKIRSGHKDSNKIRSEKSDQVGKMREGQKNSDQVMHLLSSFDNRDSYF